jgi:hypothetical protein
VPRIGRGASAAGGVWPKSVSTLADGWLRTGDIGRFGDAALRALCAASLALAVSQRGEAARPAALWPVSAYLDLIHAWPVTAPMPGDVSPDGEAAIRQGGAFVRAALACARAGGDTLAGMELRRLRHVIEIVRRASFGKAAEKRRITQRPLSKGIRNVERTPGVQLLEQHPGRVAPADYGALFVDHATLIAAELERAVEEPAELKGRGKGAVRVGAGATMMQYPLPQAVLAFIQADRLSFAFRDAGSRRPPAASAPDRRCSWPVCARIASISRSACRRSSALIPATAISCRSILPNRSGRASSSASRTAGAARCWRRRAASSNG